MEDSRTCPICDTSNSLDAIHCEVCGERLVPEDFETGDAAEELASDGGEVVGFAVEDSGAEDLPPATIDVADESPLTVDVELDDIEGESPEPPPTPPEFERDETDVTSDSLDAESLAEGDAVELEDGPGESSAADAEEADAEEAEPMDQAALDAEFEALEEEFGNEDSNDEPPDYLYSPMDGAAYPRGSAEYDEGFGPNGEELVATAPDIATYVSEVSESHDGAGLSEASGASMGDAELAAAAAPSSQVSAEFQRSFQAQPKQRASMAPLPEPGTFLDPAVLTVYANRQPVMRLAIDMDEVLIGRRDPVADAYPDLDLSELDPHAHISRKHAYIYRQNKNYTLYAVSNAGTQLNADLLELGDRRALSDGDVIVLAGKIAMKFELPNH